MNFIWVCQADETNLYDASDEEGVNIGADIGHFEVVEPDVPNGPVPEKARTDTEPIFYLSQHESREFRHVTELHQHLEAEEEEDGEKKFDLT